MVQQTDTTFAPFWTAWSALKCCYLLPESFLETSQGDLFLEREMSVFYVFLDRQSDNETAFIPLKIFHWMVTQSFV